MLALTATIADAATIEIFPSNADASCNEEFETRVNALAPGDVLILHGGIYTQTCRRAITVNGTPTNPITIRAADGETPIITRPQPANFSYDHNNIEIVNSSHLIIRGLHFKGGDGGISFNGGHHITFEGSEVYETGNNALRMNSGNTDSFIIRGNHIHHTRGTGSGGNDGIEAKAGSYNVTVRNNVIHDTIIGNHYPCIFVYGGGAGLNIVEGNVMWNCGEAIQVVSDAIVRNNLILNSTIIGINAGPHSAVAGMKNVTIVNNTVYGHPACLSIGWSGRATWSWPTTRSIAPAPRRFPRRG